jgi:hypothetical protein
MSQGRITNLGRFPEPECKISGINAADVEQGSCREQQG